MFEGISRQSAEILGRLLEQANLARHDILVVGCSTSEVSGSLIGSDSSVEVAGAILDGICPMLCERGIFLAAQCCEHLNRAIIIERAAARRYRLAQVNAVPRPTAGGAFASAAYARFREPVAVEGVSARAGMDIGDTLIGMHLMRVAVPVRVGMDEIGKAHVVCARTRPPFIGGERAGYDSKLL